MKKFILGAAIGAGLGVVLTYLAVKAQKEGYLDEIRDKADDMTLKTKKKVKDVWDLSKNKAEYLLEKTENAIKKGRDKIVKPTEEP